MTELTISDCPCPGCGKRLGEDYDEHGNAITCGRCGTTHDFEALIDAYEAKQADLRNDAEQRRFELHHEREYERKRGARNEHPSR